MYKQISQKIHSLFQQTYRRKYKQNNEQSSTIIAAIGYIFKQNSNIVSIGFGTKSLPYTIIKQNPKTVIKDMHAEILAIKGFRKFLLTQINQQSSQFLVKDPISLKKLWNSDKYKLFLYSSQVLCGDCLVDENNSFFSGAKPLIDFNCIQYQEMKYLKNVLRTKPGRLDLPIQKRSLSLSCSDKIALYNIIGYQGRRLFRYLTPVYMNYIIIKAKQQQKFRISQGINFIHRLAELRNKPQAQIIEKIYNIKVKEGLKTISKQFKNLNPEIIIIQEHKQAEIIQLQQFQQDKKTIMDLCGIILEGNVSWINGRNGLPEGSNLKTYAVKGSTSMFSTSKMYQGLEECILQKQFKYICLKEQIKKMFGLWTDNYKN